MGLKCQTSVGVEREGAKGCRVTICPGWSPLAPPRWELWVEGKSVFLPAGGGRVTAPLKARKGASFPGL